MKKITIPTSLWRELFARAQWQETVPADITLPEEVWDELQQAFADALESFIPMDRGVFDVETGNRKTLFVILSGEKEAEERVQLVRKTR